MSKKPLNDIMKRKPDPKIVGTRWVFTENVIQGKPDYKARLVVQGCQEDKGHIRTDASTGLRDAFFMTLSAAAQDGWDCNVFDAQSPYLQRRHQETVAVADASQKSAFWDETRASVCNWFDLRDQRRWTCVVRAQQESARWSQGWNKAYSTCMDLLDVRLPHTQDVQRCIAASCARATFATTVGHGRVLWSDHLQGWQSHQGDAGQVNDEPQMYEHRFGLTNSGKPTH